MTFFPTSPIWDVIREPAKTLTSLDHISENTAIKELKFEPKDNRDFSSKGFLF